MRLVLAAVSAHLADGTVHRAPVDGGGAVALGPLVVEVAESGRGGSASTTWAVANRGDHPVALVDVRLVFRVLDAPEPLRLWSHGYQSWTPCRTVVLGVDRDPSLAEGSVRFLRDMHHADPEPAEADELRSEMVTVLAGAGGPSRLVGFDAGWSHDGTLRVRPGDREGPGGHPEPELQAAAHLGGAVLGGGDRRPLHTVTTTEGDDVHALLVGWAERVGRGSRARTSAPFQVGWCSWYHYFHDVTEAAVLDNLARAGDWPFDVFQLDDGYQAAIGDWLRTEASFPSGVEGVAAEVGAAGLTPGIWLAPFIADPGSEVATDHPELFARDLHEDQPQVAMFHPEWGGFMWGLDTTRPEVLAHLEQVAGDLVAAGYRYLKLDFTFAPALEGRFADPSRTPAERLRAGYEAVRRGAGDDTFLLGCGAPLGALVGVVDGMRIGEDVAPSWDLEPETAVFPGYEEAAPATRHAWRNTLARSFQHRRLWLNDPDCVMLRTRATAMSEAQVRTWAHGVGVSGGMVLVSDDLALLDDEARGLLDEVLAIGRAADREAEHGLPPRCPDLLEPGAPALLEAGPYRLEADADAGTSVLSTADGGPGPAGPEDEP